MEANCRTRSHKLRQDDPEREKNPKRLKTMGPTFSWAAPIQPTTSTQYSDKPTSSTKPVEDLEEQMAEAKLGKEMDNVVIGDDLGNEERVETMVQGDRHDIAESVEMDVQVEKPIVEKAEGVSTPFAHAFSPVSGEMKKDKNKEAMLEVKVEDAFDTLFYTINREHTLDKDYENQQLANMMRSSFTWEQQQPEHFDPVIT